MGSIIGSVIGGVGSVIAGNAQAKAQRYAADKAAEAGRLGFDYLKGSPLGTQYLPTGGRANAAIANALGVGDDPQSAQANVKNFFDSTGGSFQLQQGQNAITGNAATRGMLRSGATLKALTKFGQGFASSTFDKYLNQLGALQAAGLQAGASIGGAASNAGTVGAAQIGQGYGAAAGSQAAGIQGAGRAIGNVFENISSRVAYPAGFEPPAVNITGPVRR